LRHLGGDKGNPIEQRVPRSSACGMRWRLVAPDSHDS